MRATVVFITDFGHGGGGAMAGVVKSVSSDLDVYDFTHEIEPYNVRQASYQLSTVTPYWPCGTVFVCVVDFGVGSGRRSCVATLKNGCHVITPDNGTLTMVADDIVEVHRIDERANRLPGSEDVHIFHGRDIFAFTAARLAAGLVTPDEIGPVYAPQDVMRVVMTSVEPRLEPGWAEGGIYDFDVPYGSARINVRNCDFRRVAGFVPGDLFRVTVHDGRRLVYEGVGRYGQNFIETEDQEANIVGDIQPGERQMLRFNTWGGFLQTHAPELLDNLQGAASWRVRFEREP